LIEQPTGLVSARSGSAPPSTASSASRSHEAAHIAGDRFIELAELPAQSESIDRDRPVVFYCRSGSRSAMATEAFRNAGFDAHNMVGGLLDWNAAGLPLVSN
jgi:rhodanese-related sulfurtransferase